MKEIISAELLKYMYYIVALFYIATDLILSLLHLNINKLGQRIQTVKVIVLFLIVLILVNIFFPSLTIYFLIPITVSGILFLLCDKGNHFAGEKFMYFIDETWQNILNFGKNWFKFGLLGSLVGIIIAIIQVQFFQGGNGGFFTMKNVCIEYSANGTDCLLNGSYQQIIGDRLAFVILIYGGQAFIWAGLIFALLKDKGKILTSLGLGELIGKINGRKK